MNNRIEKLQPAVSWTLFHPTPEDNSIYATCNVYDTSGNPVAVVEFEFFDDTDYLSYSVDPVVKFCNKFYWIRKAGFSIDMDDFDNSELEFTYLFPFMESLDFVYNKIKDLRICLNEDQKSWTIFDIKLSDFSFSINTSVCRFNDNDIMSMVYRNKGSEKEKTIMLNFFDQSTCKSSNGKHTKNVSAWFNINDRQKKTSIRIEEI